MSERMNGEELRTLLERLTGQPLPAADQSELLTQVAAALSAGQTIGYSQFNELLLNVGYDRVCPEFFLFICDPAAVSIDAKGQQGISSSAALTVGVDCFRELALLLYGNIKFGFKKLSLDAETLTFFIRKARQERSDLEFRSRHDPLIPLKRIDGEDTYLLGYISGREIDDKLRQSPDDPVLLEQKRNREEVISKGKWNHNVYLTSDHLDVYVATSMRERHEYIFVNEFMSRMENNLHVKDLNLRLFDPTQAFCQNRIDKGLAEALMLKRAGCTVYLAQESDTLGKDSELASTLAQGKPVIAFVPKMSDNFWALLYASFRKLQPDEDERATLIRILQSYQTSLAWSDSQIQEHLLGISLQDIDSLTKRVRNAVENHYNKRADVLKNSHPLGLQTNLNTGVANGVLVVRSIENCAQLVRRILLNKMEFSVEDTMDGYVMLREKISNCVFRVMTADRSLTNSFWNFYTVT